MAWKVPPLVSEFSRVSSVSSSLTMGQVRETEEEAQSRRNIGRVLASQRRVRRLHSVIAVRTVSSPVVVAIISYLKI